MTRRYGHSANAGLVLSAVPPVQPHRRGMQPPPSDPDKLAKTCNRLAWEIKVLHGRRAPLVLLLDRYDQKLAHLRRQFDEYGAALESLAPERWASIEQDKREYDDPIRALAWAQRVPVDGGGE